MDHSKEMLATIATLESKVDMLETELTTLNEILTKCGFSKGVETLKATVMELLDEEAEEAKQRKSS